MKVLLDENLDPDLRKALVGHEVFSVRYLGWNGKSNGELMDLMTADGFEAMITNDHHIQHQQPASRVRVAVLVTTLQRPDLPYLLQLVPDLLRVLATNPPPGFYHIP